MKCRSNDSSRKNIILLIILGLAVGGLMVMTVSCAEGVKCTDIKTMFCAIIKELAPASVQPALEDCPTSLIICEGEEIVLYWQGDATLTSNVSITGPAGEVYDFPISEGFATVTPVISGEWKITFTGEHCRISKSISIRVIKGPEPYTIVANGNIDTGFFCDINPKSVSKKVIVLSIRSTQCGGASGFYWENWSGKKTEWNGSNPIFLNITKDDGSANNTQLAGHWSFYPTGMGGTSSYTEKSACFRVTICCEPCNQSPTDIYPTPTPTPWPTRSPQ